MHGNTYESLKKLNEEQTGILKNYSSLIPRRLVMASSEEYKQVEYKGKIQGFLECLLQMGIINSQDLKTLYLWFSEADRSAEKGCSAKKKTNKEE